MRKSREKNTLVFTEPQKLLSIWHQYIKIYSKEPKIENVTSIYNKKYI